MIKLFFFHYIFLCNIFWPSNVLEDMTFELFKNKYVILFQKICHLDVLVCKAENDDTDIREEIYKCEDPLGNHY